MAGSTVVYRLLADVTQFRAQLAQAGASTKALGDTLTKVGKEGEAMRRGITTFGSAAGKVGLVAAAGLGAAVLTAARFDAAMSNVEAATHESASNMELLRAAAIKAGADTVFSASEAAGAIEALAKAGVSTADILGGGLQDSLNLAAAGSLDVAQAADIAATTMNQFGLSGSDVGHIADVLSAAAGKAQGSVEDMAGALQYVGPVAAQMGLTLDETAGAIAELASQGILGTQAGTALRGMLTALTSPSKMARDQMEALGISMYDASGKFVGFDGVAGQLQQTMANLSAADRDEALGRIFGNEQITAARILYAGGAADVREWTKQVNDSGYAAETAAIKLDNLKGDFEQLKGSLETALIGAGSGQQSGLRTLVQDLTAVVNVFNKIPDSAQSSTTSLLGVTAVLGGGTWFAAKSIVGVSNMRKALDEVGPAGTRAAAGLRAVSVVAAAGLGLDIAVSLADQLQRSLDKAAPNIYLLRSNLQDLAKGGDVSSVVNDVGDLSAAIDSVSDPTKFKAITDFYDQIPVFGDVLPKLLDIAPVSSSQLQGLRDAQTSLTAVDEAISSLAASDGPKAARQAFEDLADTYHLTADEQERLVTLLPTAQTFLENVGQSAHKAGTETGFFADVTGKYLGLVSMLPGSTNAAGSAVGMLGNKSKFTAEQLKVMQKALDDAQKEARGVGEEFFGLGEKLDKAKVSLGQWLRDLEKQAVALRDFRINAQQAAKRGLDDGLIASLEKAGPAGALRMKQLADATDAEIARANRAWRSGQREIDKYVDATVHVPKALATDLNVNDHATGPINAVVAEMRALDGDHATVYLIGKRIGDSFSGAFKASGGPIAGPGTGTSDQVPIWASNGEHMWTAREVANAGGHRAVEAMRSQFRFAEGGAVRVQAAAPRVSVTSGPVNVGGSVTHVFVDGREVRAVVRSEQSRESAYQRNLDDRP